MKTILEEGLLITGNSITRTKKAKPFTLERDDERNKMIVHLQPPRNN